MSVGKALTCRRDSQFLLDKDAQLGLVLALELDEVWLEFVGELWSAEEVNGVAGGGGR
jgi:hypothetical protein